MASGDHPEETRAHLWLAGVGWAVLTLVLMALLGFALPLLIAGSLSPDTPRVGLIAGAIVGVSLTIATAVLLLRDTRRRYAEQPRLRRALTIGYIAAMLISTPALLLWLGAGLMAALGE